MRLVSLLVLTAVLNAACAHSQPTASAKTPVERRVYVISQDATGIGGSGPRDCDQEQIQCFRDCMDAPAPWPIKTGDRGHYKHCQTTCLAGYMECVKEVERAQKRFDLGNDMDIALAWLRAHKAELAIGTVVVVGGIVFTVATGGAGLILTPLAL